jgi:hypothetical protein
MKHYSDLLASKFGTLPEFMMRTETNLGFSKQCHKKKRTDQIAFGADILRRTSEGNHAIIPASN